MRCEICGERAGRLPLNVGLHDRIYLCSGHAIGMSAALDANQSAIFYMSTCPLNVDKFGFTSETSAPVKPLEAWQPPIVGTIGANPQSGRPRMPNARVWVNAFTHRATDPRKSWPT